MREKNLGLELYRIVLTFMICILHVLGHGGILSSTTKGTLDNSILWFVELFCFMSVDGYALISGYNSKSKEIKYYPIIIMWFQVFCYSFGLSFVMYLTNFFVDLQFKDILSTAFPLVKDSYWYFTAFFPLFLLKPFINRCLDSLTNNEKKCLLATIFLLISFSFYRDFLQTNDGYSFLWLFILYVVGYLLRELSIFDCFSSKNLLVLLLVSTFASYFFVIILDMSSLITYISPFILIEAICLLGIFSKMNIKNNNILKISRLTFGIYLFQNNKYIWMLLFNCFVFMTNYHILLKLSLTFIFSLLLFILGAIADTVRFYVFAKLKVRNIAMKIDKFIKNVIEIVECKLESLLN